MEHTNNGSEAKGDAAASRSAVATGAKKVERIAKQSKGLLDDVRDWIDLKIELLEIELQEKVLGYAVVGTLGVLALVFLFITIALGLGIWLGHPVWGFLIVTVVMLGLAGITYRLKIAPPKAKKPVPQPQHTALPEGDSPKQLPEATVES